VSPRPLTTTTAEILEATARVVGRRGPARLTLADVSAEVGLAPATLVQRFGSRRGLLLALAAGASEDVTRTFEAASATTGSSLEALHAALAAIVADIDRPETLANQLPLLQMDLSDPEFHRHALDHWHAMHDGIRRLLEAAVQAGDLVDCDTNRLAEAVRVTFDGAQINWAIRAEGPLVDRLRSEVEFTLARFRPSLNR
jgi:AcrR family transcriptional regulator